MYQPEEKQVTQHPAFMIQGEAHLARVVDVLRTENARLRQETRELTRELKTARRIIRNLKIGLKLVSEET
jgi:hypothetical protein